VKVDRNRPLRLCVAIHIRSFYLDTVLNVLVKLASTPKAINSVECDNEPHPLSARI